MPIVGISELPGDALRDRRGHGLEHEQECARGLGGMGVVQEAQCRLGGLALRAIAALRGRRLRRQPEVGDDRDSGARQRADASEHRPRALQLDGLRGGLLEEPPRGAQGVLVAHLVRHERQVSDEDALRAAGRFLKEAAAHAVKLEGAGPMLARIRALAGAGIPVVAHLGLTPQTATSQGGYRAQGKTAQAALRLLHDAHAAEAAGAFLLVLEAVPLPSRSASAASSRSRRSASERAPAATARCSCSTTCWAWARGRCRASSSSTRRSATWPSRP